MRYPIGGAKPPGRNGADGRGHDESNQSRSENVPAAWSLRGRQGLCGRSGRSGHQEPVPLVWCSCRAGSANDEPVPSVKAQSPFVALRCDEAEAGSSCSPHRELGGSEEPRSVSLPPMLGEGGENVDVPGSARLVLELLEWYEERGHVRRDRLRLVRQGIAHERGHRTAPLVNHDGVPPREGTFVASGAAASHLDRALAGTGQVGPYVKAQTLARQNDEVGQSLSVRLARWAARAIRSRVFKLE